MTFGFVILLLISYTFHKAAESNLNYLRIAVKINERKLQSHRVTGFGTE